MTIPTLEIEAQTLADFGVEVTVTPATGEPYTLTMLYDERDEDSGLGHIRGNLSQPVFRCMPAPGTPIVPGTILTMGGIDYKVFDALPRHHALTEIRAVEQ